MAEKNDIFAPDISTIQEGIQGKIILIYGDNGTGKTSNAVQAPSPFVFAFENGLNAIKGVPYKYIKDWNAFRQMVRQFTDPKTSAQAHERYKTIIVDSIDGMGRPADNYVASIYNAQSVADGNDGFGLWKEYENEIGDQIDKLAKSGFTVIFLDHSGKRDFPLPQGGKREVIYPKGEKRVVDPIVNSADIIGYTELQPNDANNRPVPASLYLIGNSAFLAKSRYPYIQQVIPAWNYDKLVAAINAAIEAQGGAEAPAAQPAGENAGPAPEPIEMLVQHIGIMLQAMGQQDGNLDKYKAIMQNKLGTTEFRAQAATEKDRSLLESLIEGLKEAGYSY